MREKGRSKRLKTWEEIDPPLTGLEDRGKEPMEGNVDGAWNPMAIKGSRDLSPTITEN